MLRDHRFTRVDKHAAEEELARRLREPLKPHEEKRRDISRRLFPHVKQFYMDEGYLNEVEHEPFYRTSSRF